MQGEAFDTFIRTLGAGHSRRMLLLSSGTIFGLIATLMPGNGLAKKKNRKKPKNNAFGCLNVGKACNGKNAKCCSGVCQGKRPKKGDKDKSECKAHNVGSCRANQDNCVASTGPCGTEGACFRTTGNASFCGGNGVCLACKKDTECEALGFGVGAACAVCIECQATGGTGCSPAAA